MEVKTINSRVDMDNFVLFETLRGSSVQGTFDASKGSDRDYYGIVYDPETALNGRINKYSNKSNDVTYYDIDRFKELLVEGNPDTIEMISINPIHFTINPCSELKWIFNNPKLFYTRKMFKAFLGFIESQVKKSITKLNKKMESKIQDFKNKQFIDFLSVKNSFLEGNNRLRLDTFLEKYGLNKEFIKRMELSKNDPNFEELIKRVKATVPDWESLFEKLNYYNSISEMYYSWKLAYESDPIGTEYSFTELFPHSDTGDLMMLVESGDLPNSKYGIYNSNAMTTGGNLIGSSAIGRLEEQFPIGILFYDGKNYETFCREKKEYEDWDRKKNIHRFLNNQGSQYDIKNAAHAVRILNMLIELVQSPIPTNLKVDRTGIDADYIKSIKYQTDENRIPQAEMLEIIQSKKDKLIESLNENLWIPEELDQEILKALNESIDSIKRKRLKEFLNS